MEWPSDRVVKGGLFHPPTNTYNQRTSDFIKVLNKETMMNTMFRDKRQYYLRSDSNSGARSKRQSAPRSSEGPVDLLQVSRNPPQITISPGLSKRRSLSSIEGSGAYARERFIPKVGIQSREEMKKRLQDRMAFGDEVKTSLRVRVEPPEETPRKLTAEEVKMARYAELMQEINEREEWLKEMEALGQAGNHKHTIREQICEKLREIDALKLDF